MIVPRYTIRYALGYEKRISKKQGSFLNPVSLLNSEVKRQINAVFSIKERLYEARLQYKISSSVRIMYLITL